MGGSAWDDGGGALQERDTAESAILRSREWQKYHAAENDELCLTDAELVTRQLGSRCGWRTGVWQVGVGLRARWEWRWVRGWKGERGGRRRRQQGRHSRRAMTEN